MSSKKSLHVSYKITTLFINWAVARFENLGGNIVLGEDNVPPPLIKIELIDLPKSGGGHVSPPPSPPATGLINMYMLIRLKKLKLQYSHTLIG